MQGLFRFLIQIPRRDAIDGIYQTCSITLTAPAVKIRREFDRALPEAEALRLMKAELKIAMIETLLNGEWELEKVRKDV